MAVAALKHSDLDEKTSLVNQCWKRWQSGSMSITSGTRTKPPTRPGRPTKPELVAPQLVPRRSLGSKRGMVALLHAIAHIELNAIDLALDILCRFSIVRNNKQLQMPRSFYHDWLKVAFEEAKHFNLLRDRLSDFGAAYGDLPAHDGLWEAAQKTTNDLTARLAVVPLVLEARGLDITPSLLMQIENLGDDETAKIFKIIYQDEKGHVAVGAKWFRYLCHKQSLRPDKTFQKLVRENFHTTLKPPFNDVARAQSGITPSFYRALSPLGTS